MNEDRRQRRITIGAVCITLLLHGAILLALAVAGEWRVFRFLPNAVVQLDVILMLSWVVWKAVTVPVIWPLAKSLAPERPGKLYAAFLRALGHVIVVSPPGAPLVFSDPRERFETIVDRLMFVCVVMLGLATLMTEGWDQIYAMLVPLTGFVAVSIAIGLRALHDRRAKVTMSAGVPS